MSKKYWTIKTKATPERVHKIDKVKFWNAVARSLGSSVCVLLAIGIGYFSSGIQYGRFPNEFINVGEALFYLVLFSGMLVFMFISVIGFCVKGEKK
jgi:hypothetical protein